MFFLEVFRLYQSGIEPVLKDGAGCVTVLPMVLAFDVSIFPFYLLFPASSLLSFLAINFFLVMMILLKKKKRPLQIDFKYPGPKNTFCM